MYRLFIVNTLLAIYSIGFGQIIADHTVVDKFQDIPQQYVDEIKKMWLVVPGESHSEAYRVGLSMLESEYPEYAVSVVESGEPEAYTEDHLRTSRATWGDFNNESGWIYFYGEEDWWTNSTAISRTKAGILYCNSVGLTISAFGFGWCYDAMGGGPTFGTDPITGNRWWGSANESGGYAWGIDEEDRSVTGNSVCLDTYLNATQEYIDYCEANNIPTSVFFTTGPVDNDNGLYNNENRYQAHLKYERIREYVSNDPSLILFDYADILCYDDNGTLNTDSWNGNVYPTITYNNVTPSTQTGHISYVGAVRLAKAMWWMLARIAGWDGTINGDDTSSPSIPANLLSNTISSSSVGLSWTASTDNIGVTEYNIYRNDIYLASTVSTSYTDNSVAPCAEYTYTVTALDAAGNESAPSDALLVSTCTPDLAPTLIVTPNISHGITSFNVIVRTTELNLAQTNGDIIVRIPRDSRWALDGTFNQSLTMLGGMPLDNSDWSYSSDATYHIFTTATTLASGGISTFGFAITFDPGTSKGEYTITSQLVEGSGGETRYTNNTDSERLDYFPEEN